METALWHRVIRPRLKSSADLCGLLEAVASGGRKAFRPLTAIPRSDIVRENELIWMQARRVDGVQALLAAGAPVYAAIGKIDWPGGSAAAIPAFGHSSALATFLPWLP